MRYYNNLCYRLRIRCPVGGTTCTLSSLSEEESCLSSVAHSSWTSSEDSNVDDEEPSVKENAAHVYSELTAIRDKLHVR